MNLPAAGFFRIFQNRIFLKTSYKQAKHSGEMLTGQFFRMPKHWAAGPRGTTSLPGQREIERGYTPRLPDGSRPKQAKQIAGQLCDSGKAQ